MSEKMSIVVVGCDAYSDIAEYYLWFLHKNWSDCRYPIYIATETHNFKDEKANNVICGKGSTWTGRAIQAINSTDSQYILLTVDDIYISEKVDSAKFEEILSFMELEKIKYYRIPVFRTTSKFEKAYPENENAEMIPTKKPYAVSIGTAIWDRNEILRILGDGTKSAWDLENDFSEMSIGGNGEYIDKYVSDKRFLLHSVHMVKAGKWIPKAANLMNQKGYEIDYSKRGFIPRNQVVKYQIYAFGSKICPPSMRKWVKAALSKIGFKFATKY